MSPPFLHFVEHATGEVILVPASLNQNQRNTRPRSQPVRSPPRDIRRPLKTAAPQHLAESRYSAGWYQPRQNASSQVLLSRMAEMIKPTIE